MTKKTSDADPRPVREAKWRTVLEDVDFYSTPLAELSDFLIQKCRAAGLSEDEIASARLEMNLHGYDSADIQLNAHLMESEREYEIRLLAWQERDEQRKEGKREALRKAERQCKRDEAEFERLRKVLGK